MCESYPYRFIGMQRLAEKYNQHCRIVAFEKVRGFVTVEFADGERHRVSRLNLRLREKYRREEVYARA